MSMIVGGLVVIAAWLACRQPTPPADPRVAVVRLVEDLLPQTQCRQCGYQTCREYAEAVVRARRSISLCVPGGAFVIRRLAELTGRAAPVVAAPPREPSADYSVAVIVEPQCIGCTKCIQACPVDAIVGAPQHMHTVLAEACSGCRLCLPACPVDCIEITSGRRDVTVPIAARGPVARARA